MTKQTEAGRRPPYELVLKGSPDKTIGWACGECRVYFTDRDQAERCHGPYLCETCGAECRRFWTACSDCQAKRSAEREAARVEAATKMSPADYDGPVYSDRYSDYYADLDTYIEHCESVDQMPEAHVWTCEKFGISAPEAERVVEDLLEAQEHHADAMEQVDGIDELQAALDAWAAKQTVETWHQSFNAVVVVAP